jgi:hypothetical protein
MAKIQAQREADLKGIVGNKPPMSFWINRYILISIYYKFYIEINLKRKQDK